MRDYFLVEVSDQSMNTILPESEADVIAKTLRQALLQIHIYRSKHTIDDPKQEDIQALFTADVFSPEIASFLMAHQARFYGFPEQPASNIAVLDVFQATTCFRGFGDGHVELVADDAAKHLSTPSGQPVK